MLKEIIPPALLVTSWDWEASCLETTEKNKGKKQKQKNVVKPLKNKLIN